MGRFSSSFNISISKSKSKSNSKTSKTSKTKKSSKKNQKKLQAAISSSSLSSGVSAFSELGLSSINNSFNPTPSTATRINTLASQPKSGGRNTLECIPENFKRFANDPLPAVPKYSQLNAVAKVCLVEGATGIKSTTPSVTSSTSSTSTKEDVHDYVACTDPSAIDSTQSSASELSRLSSLPSYLPNSFTPTYVTFEPDANWHESEFMLEQQRPVGPNRHKYEYEEQYEEQVVDTISTQHQQPPPPPQPQPRHIRLFGSGYEVPAKASTRPSIPIIKETVEPITSTKNNKTSMSSTIDENERTGGGGRRTSDSVFKKHNVFKPVYKTCEPNTTKAIYCELVDEHMGNSQSLPRTNTATTLCQVTPPTSMATSSLLSTSPIEVRGLEPSLTKQISSLYVTASAAPTTVPFTENKTQEQRTKNHHRQQPSPRKVRRTSLTPGKQTPSSRSRRRSSGGSINGVVISGTGAQKYSLNNNSGISSNNSNSTTINSKAPSSPSSSAAARLKKVLEIENENKNPKTHTYELSTPTSRIYHLSTTTSTPSPTTTGIAARRGLVLSAAELNVNNSTTPRAQRKAPISPSPSSKRKLVTSAATMQNANLRHMAPKTPAPKSGKRRSITKASEREKRERDETLMRPISNSLTHEEWYHGDITRDQAVHQLITSVGTGATSSRWMRGLFLVREKTPKSCFVVSVLTFRPEPALPVEHIRIHRVQIQPNHNAVHCFKIGSQPELYTSVADAVHALRTDIMLCQRFSKMKCALLRKVCRVPRSISTLHSTHPNTAVATPSPTVITTPSNPRPSRPPQSQPPLYDNQQYGDDENNNMEIACN